MSGRAPRGQGRGQPRGQSSLPHHFSDGAQRGASRGDFTPHTSRGGSRGDSRGSRGGFGRGRGGSIAEVQVYRAGPSVPLPDSTVLHAENETEKSQQASRTKTIEQKENFHDARRPARPGYGTQGQKVVLWANYFHVAVQQDLLLQRYDVKVTGQQAARSPVGKKLKRIIQLLIDDHLESYKSGLVTDFKSNLLSKATIPENTEYSVIYRAEKEDEPSPNATVYRVQLQLTGTVAVSDLIDYLNSTQASRLLNNKDEIIQAMNIVLGHRPKANDSIASVGANKHFRYTAPMERFDLGAGLDALRGFFVSVRASTARLLVNVQVKHGAFYKEGPLDRLMAAFISDNGSDRAKLHKFVKRVSVEPTHIVKKNKAGVRIPRRKIILGLATRDDGQDDPHPPIVSDFGAGPKDVKFFVQASAAKPPTAQAGPAGTSKKKKKAAGPTQGPSGEGTYISVYDFFRNTYNIIIADPSLPVVNVGTRERPSYLPAQICSVLPGQPSNTALSPSQTQQMIRFAVRKPLQNAESIVTSGLGTLALNTDNPILTAFGINVTPNLITVPGRVLNGPEVKYNGMKSIATRFGSWNMQNVKFSTSADLPFWTYLWISEDRGRDPWSDDAALTTTIDSFTTELRNVGIRAAECTPGMHIKVQSDTKQMEQAVDLAFHRFSSSTKRQPPKMVLVILPSTSSSIYNRVKYACDVQEGLLNVCVVASKFAKANSQYHANVALKVNLKLGGRNQFLDNPKLGILSEGRTMVIGIDVTHPSPGSSPNAPSVAAVVGSVDQWLGQWPADLRIQTGRQEMVADLSGMLESRLRLWTKKNPALPENILVYRDGVSEGQYDLVLDHELPALRKACEQVYPATSTKKGLPHFTIIVVGKRHNTRFYPTNKDDADRSSNPKNGTVVDRGVTEARNWDFFLQAHTALQGTARPAHYYVIYDEIFRGGKIVAPSRNSSDVIQDLTHNLCYLFGRATKAVSICPPAYYADLVCERARCYLSKVFDPSVSERFGSSTTSGEADPKSVLIHPKVRDSMFYI